MPAVSWPWAPAWGLLEPPRRDGENAQKTGKNGEKMGEIQPKTCEGRELTKNQLAAHAARPALHAQGVHRVRHPDAARGAEARPRRGQMIFILTLLVVQRCMFCAEKMCIRSLLFFLRVSGGLRGRPSSPLRAPPLSPPPPPPWSSSWAPLWRTAASSAASHQHDRHPACCDWRPS